MFLTHNKPVNLAVSGYSSLQKLKKNKYFRGFLIRATIIFFKTFIFVQFKNPDVLWDTYWKTDSWVAEAETAAPKHLHCICLRLIWGWVLVFPGPDWNTVKIRAKISTVLSMHWNMPRNFTYSWTGASRMVQTSPQPNPVEFWSFRILSLPYTS